MFRTFRARERNEATLPDATFKAPSSAWSPRRISPIRRTGGICWIVTENRRHLPGGLLGCRITGRRARPRTAQESDEAQAFRSYVSSTMRCRSAARSAPARRYDDSLPVPAVRPACTRAADGEVSVLWENMSRKAVTLTGVTFESRSTAVTVNGSSRITEE